MKKIVLIAALSIVAVVSSVAQDLNGLKQVNGTSLYFKTIGSGEPVLVVHGGPGMNHAYFLPHFEALGEKVKLVFYDQRASGQSATPSSDSISLKFFADDIEAIRVLLGVEKINLLAHSWGSVVAVSYARYYPERVKKMVLSNPVPLSHEYDKEIQAKQFALVQPRDSSDRSVIIGSRDFKSHKPDAYENLLRVSFRHSFHDPRDLNKLILDLPDNYATASTALYTGLTKDLLDFNFYDDASKFSFPLLIVRGRYDLVPLQADTRLQSLAPGASLLVFTRSGHFPFIEEKGKFTRDVAAFFLSR